MGEASYGVDSYLPKHHYSVHLPSQLERFGLVPSCFVHERRHKILKRHLRPNGCILVLVDNFFCDLLVITCLFQ